MLQGLTAGHEIHSDFGGFFKLSWRYSRTHRKYTHCFLDNFPPITKNDRVRITGNRRQCIVPLEKAALITKDCRSLSSPDLRSITAANTPRADLSNTCSITIANTSADGIAPLPIDATMDNISANGFAFLTKKEIPFFTDHKGRHPCYDP